MPDVARLIEESGAIKRGTFELSSGGVSEYYIDKYVFETQPEVLDAIGEAIAARLAEREVDVLAGPALGAIPLVTAASLKTGIPAAYIRGDRKEHGTEARIEGDMHEGDRVALIEDVTTTGETVIEAARLIEAVGGVVDRLLVVADRNADAAKNVREAGYELEAIVRVGENLDVGSESDPEEA